MPIIKPKQLSKSLDGDYVFNGSVTVEGIATFVQTSSAHPAIIVSGSQQVVNSINDYSGSITIQGLGTLSNTGSNSVVDLGDESF